MAVDRATGALIRRSVLHGTLSNYAGKLVMLAIGLLVTPFVLAHIGPTDFGLLALVGSVVAYGSLLDLGISGAVIKYVAHHATRGEEREARATIATALLLYTALGAVAAVLGLILAPFFPTLFHIPPAQHATARGLVMLMGLGIGISIPGAVPAAILAGLRRFDILNLVGITAALLSAAATVAVLLLGGGVLAITAANIGVSLVTQALNLGLLRRIAPGLLPGWRDAAHERVRAIASFSASVFAVQVAGRVQSKTDEVVIAAFLPVSAVTPFALARRLGEIPQTLTDQFMKVLLPLAATLDATDDRGRLREVWLTGTRLTLALCAPLSGGLAVLGGPVLAAWVGPAYAGYGPLVTILALAILLDTAMWPTGSVLQGMGRHRPLALIALGSAAANLGLSIGLAPRYGLIGVALGTLIPTAIEASCIVLPYAMRTLGISGRAMWRSVLAPVIAPAGLMLLVLVLASQHLGTDSPPALVTVAVAGGVTYGMAYMILARGLSEREMVMGGMTQVMARWRARS